MTYPQIVCETCSVVLREGRANKTVDGRRKLLVISVEKEGLCKQEEGRQFLVGLCVEEDIL